MAALDLGPTPQFTDWKKVGTFYVSISFVQKRGLAIEHCVVRKMGGAFSRRSVPATCLSDTPALPTVPMLSACEAELGVRHDY